MVRYPEGHKEDTRREIVAAASRAFREGGLTEVSIPKLMRDAGLTHGAFYWHFDSKDALIAEANAWGLREMTREMYAHAASPEGGHRALGAVLERYLSRGHRDHPESGCVVPALGAQLARQSPEVRGKVGQALGDYLRMIDDVRGQTDREDPSNDALVIMAQMVGAVLLARLIDDPALSERVLAASREFLLGTFPDQAPEPAPGT